MVEIKLLTDVMTAGSFLLAFASMVWGRKLLTRCDQGLEKQFSEKSILATSFNLV
jgi:hypothetical protein